MKKGTFNLCGRSEAWNSTHHGRYMCSRLHFYSFFPLSDILVKAVDAQST